MAGRSWCRMQTVNLAEGNDVACIRDETVGVAAVMRVFCAGAAMAAACGGRLASPIGPQFILIKDSCRRSSGGPRSIART